MSNGVAFENPMNGVFGRLCAHIGYTGPGEPSEDGEMSEMTQDSIFEPSSPTLKYSLSFYDFFCFVAVNGD